MARKGRSVLSSYNLKSSLSFQAARDVCEPAGGGECASSERCHAGRQPPPGGLQAGGGAHREEDRAGTVHLCPQCSRVVRGLPEA